MKEVILQVGMVLIPKPEHQEYLSKILLKTVHVVTKQDVDANGILGDMWMIK